MASFIRYIIWFTLSVIAIVLGVLLGDYGAWYLSWVLGTATMVLVAAMGGVLFEAQEEEKLESDNAVNASVKADASRHA